MWIFKRKKYIIIENFVFFLLIQKINKIMGIKVAILRIICIKKKFPWRPKEKTPDISRKKIKRTAEIKNIYLV